MLGTVRAFPTPSGPQLSHPEKGQTERKASKGLHRPEPWTPDAALQLQSPHPQGLSAAFALLLTAGRAWGADEAAPEGAWGTCPGVLRWGGVASPCTAVVVMEPRARPCLGSGRPGSGGGAWLRVSASGSLPQPPSFHGNRSPLHPGLAPHSPPALGREYALVTGEQVGGHFDCSQAGWVPARPGNLRRAKSG